MIRRDFIKTAGAVMASTALSAAALRAQEQTVQGRTVLPINRHWRYHPSKVAGAESPDFDDASFERVGIPHTNVELPWHNFDDKDYEFISTYRRRFGFPKEAQGKRVGITSTRFQEITLAPCTAPELRCLHGPYCRAGQASHPSQFPVLRPQARCL